jgi:hypothetical protein
MHDYLFLTAQGDIHRDATLSTRPDLVADRWHCGSAPPLPQITIRGSLQQVGILGILGCKSRTADRKIRIAMCS